MVRRTHFHLGIALITIDLLYNNLRSKAGAVLVLFDAVNPDAASSPTVHPLVGVP